MRVLYDHQSFTIQEYGGISRYFYELTKQFQLTPELEIINTVLFSNNEYIRQNGTVHSKAFFKETDFRGKNHVMRLLNEMKSLAIIKNDNFDVFHPTYYHSYFLKIKSKKPVVVTFHDLIHEKFMDYDHRTLANKKSVLNRADKIIAVSHNSKNDLINYYNISEEKITVVHLASSFPVNPIPPAELPDDLYLLYVGSRNLYKNFTFFLKAITPLLIKNQYLYLYCAGGGNFTKDEISLFRELRIKTKVISHPGSDESLQKLYSNALAFFFPSQYEGFGIPMVEAMTCGCPIAASDVSSLPEVAGDAALYFDPHDAESILSAAETLTSSEQIRTALKQKGILRAKDFSWLKTATRTQEVYSSLV